MPQTPLHLGVIGQIAVPVTNLERAVPFYRDTLGIKFLFQVPNLAFFDCAGVRLMLDVPQDGSGEPGRRSSVIYFKVDDIHTRLQLALLARRRPRRKTSPNRQNARPRSLDGLLPRPRQKSPSTNERGSPVAPACPDGGRASRRLFAVYFNS